MGQQLRLLGRTLDKALKIEVPKFKDPELEALAKKVVALHHAWANKQGEKLMVMLRETAEKANQVDKEATQLFRQVEDSLEELIRVVSDSK